MHDQAGGVLPYALANHACLADVDVEVFLDHDCFDPNLELLEKSTADWRPGKKHVVGVARVKPAETFGQPAEAAVHSECAQIGQRGRSRSTLRQARRAQLHLLHW